MSHVSSGSTPRLLEVLRESLGSAAFLESLPIGVCCCDGDGAIALYNKRAAELWGLAPKIGGVEPGGWPATATFDSKGRRVRPPIADVLRTGVPVRDERFVIERPDGTRSTILVNINPLLEPGGAVIAAVICFQDITAVMTEVDDRERERESYSRSILEALPAAVYTTDAEGKITYFNRAAVELTGRVPELGEDSWCVSWRLFTTEGIPLPHDQCPMAVALRERRIVRGQEAIAERPDGARIRFLPYPTPLFDEAGELIGAVNMLTDVTDLRETEVELAHLAAIVSSSDDAIISKSLDGRIRSWNAGAKRIFGYDADEMIGRPIISIIPPELRGEEAEIIARLKKGERIDHFETVRVAKDGRRLDISLTVSPIRDRTGTVVGASKVARDITEKKRAEELHQLLMGELNHRVKNTLATVQSIANQTVRSAKDPGEFATSFNGRIRTLAHAHDILTRNSWRGADLRDLAHDQLLIGGDQDERVTLSGPSVLLDAQPALHVAMILHELGTNARKHGALSSPEGRLAVSWTLESNGGRRLKLHWRESGGPPVAAPAARGFGTTLVEKSLAAHEGQACIHYRAEGVSCDIELPLPERPQHAAGFVATAHTGGFLMSDALSPRSQLAGRRILVVEDEPIVALDLAGALTERGCTVVGPAATLEDAMRLAETDLDVALIDANLGGQPVDDIAATLAGRSIPFAFVTGYERGGLPAAFQDAAMVNKPFSREEIVQVVTRLVADRDTANQRAFDTKP